MLELSSGTQESIRLAVLLMSELGLRPGRSPVYFGQLLGMADHITFTLGNNGYPAYKWVQCMNLGFIHITPVVWKSFSNVLHTQTLKFLSMNALSHVSL